MATAEKKHIQRIHTSRTIIVVLNSRAVNAISIENCVCFFFSVAPEAFYCIHKIHSSAILFTIEDGYYYSGKRNAVV